MHLIKYQNTSTKKVRMKGIMEVMRTFKMKVEELKMMRFVSTRKQSIERNVEVESEVYLTGMNISETTAGSVNFIERVAETI
jgi:hypothetical protein